MGHVDVSDDEGDLGGLRGEAGDRFNAVSAAHDAVAILAEDGADALNKLATNVPDLILLDLLLPEMSGDKMLAKVRAEDWGKNILVIVLTNVSQDEAPMSLRLLRVERYIVKAHYTPKQVLEVVVETLTRYKKLPAVKH